MITFSLRHELFMPPWTYHRLRVGVFWAWFAIVSLSIIADRPIAAADLVLSDFNGTGFNYTFGGFSQTTGANSVRLRDLADDLGGAGTIRSLNLSSYADSRFVIDMFRNAGNGVDKFDLELIDTSGRTGKWSFGVSNLGIGVPSTLVSTTTLSNPTHGIGDFANLDLNNITTWQILGTYSSPSPFDLSFDRVAISDTVSAPPAYPGAEPDAPWRIQAAARIDANRKADLQIHVTDALGNAISGANISVQMTDHEFGFGSAVVAARLSDNNPAHDTYKQNIARLFNIATIENNLKWPAWEGEWGNSFTRSGAQSVVNWLAGQNINVRGHTLVWPGYSNLPIPIKNILDNAPLNTTEQQDLRNAIAAHIADIAGTFTGQLAFWDVINETRTNHDVMDNLPEDNLAMVDWLNAALAADPIAKRYINEYDILSSPGGTNTFNQKMYFDTVQFLLNNNAPIDGIGFQSHFSQSNLNGPEDIWAILDRFTQLGLDMQITEFDFDTTDEQLQADFTRDFMTAVFAHEGIDDFLMWGFWEEAHWRPNAAMFNSDWSIKPNGQAYLHLVFSDWWTDENLQTAQDGAAGLRGFKGAYEIEVTHNGQSEVVVATLTEGGLSLDITLQLLSADFDGSGNVDNIDLGIWATNYGLVSEATQIEGDADGDGDVDGLDFLLWQRQFGTSLGSGVVSVPEPAGLWLIVTAFMVWLEHSRKVTSIRRHVV